MLKEQIIQLFKEKSNEELIKYKKVELMSFYKEIYEFEASKGYSRLELIGKIRAYVLVAIKVENSNKL